MLSDLALPELRQYRPDVEEPADFDEFWAGELAAAAGRSGRADVRAGPTAACGTRTCFDVTFPGYDGDPVRAWLLLPHEQRARRRAFVVEYIGYGGGRGDPFDWLDWSCAGYPHLVMDTRGQGGGWRSADTPDPATTGRRAPRAS